MKIFPSKAIVSALTHSSDKVSFLIGSPLSTEGTIGVPGVPGIVGLAREHIKLKIPSDLDDFNSSISASNSGVGSYQAALEWLQGHLGQDAVNDVIQKAVLRARRVDSPKTFDRDGAPEEWHITRGANQLAKLISHPSGRFSGPILTTNFDPLLSLAIMQLGGYVNRRVIESDGALPLESEISDKFHYIVHLHGYWRDSTTLNTSTQLTMPRPRLKASLQYMFQKKTLVVVAYSGWDDVFMNALSDLMSDDAARINVLWCFYEHRVDEILSRYDLLFQKMRPAIIRGRFTAYYGVDCHTIFGEISKGLSASSAPGEGCKAPLRNWRRIDKAFLSSLNPLQHTEIIRYFDGAWPTWRHAVSSNIPRREIVQKLLANLEIWRQGPSACALQLLISAGGEGKSTILLQVAALAAQSEKWDVIWRPEPGLPLDVDHLALLDKSRKWLIVADNAEDLVKDIEEASIILYNDGCCNIAFFIVARDTDWFNAKGPEASWSTRLNVLEPITLRGICQSDAKAIVKAWSLAGPLGLNQLSNIPDANQRVAALMAAAKDTETGVDGSFFGALLAIRFNEDGLRAHAREMLQRLKEMKLAAGRTLFDALVYIAASHAAGVPGLPANVLAKMLGAAPEWIHSFVSRRLGEEAAVTEGSSIAATRLLFTRHKNVAQAIVAEAEEHFAIDLSEIWSHLIRQCVLVQRKQSGPPSASYIRIVHAGPRISRKYTAIFPKEKANSIALAAAGTSIDMLPNRIDCLTDLGTVFRIVKDYEKSLKVFRENYRNLRDKEDYTLSVRGFWYEWGMCEGVRGNWAIDAWLQGISLSDFLEPAMFNRQRIAISCAGLGKAFEKLASQSRTDPLNAGRAAAAHIGLRMKPNGPTTKHLQFHANKTNNMRVPQPTSVSLSINILLDALLSVRSKLDNNFREEIGNEKISLKGLRDFIG